MKWEQTINVDTKVRTFTMTFDDFDLIKADFMPHEKVMVRLLEEQQHKDPTCEGILMILQYYAAAIERGQEHG